MADMNYVSPLTSDLTDYYTKSEVDELQQGDAATYATSAEIVAGDNAVKGWVASQGYLTEHQDLTNYATKAYVDEVIEDIEAGSGMTIRVVNSLPVEAEENVIYLVRKQDTEEDNIYNEWIWVPASEDYELIGDTSTGVIPDLTDYATKQWVEAKAYLDDEDLLAITNNMALKADTSWVEQQGYLVSNDLIGYATVSDLADFATKEYTDDELANKANNADLAAVATSGDYDDLSNKPTIPSLTGYATETYVNNAVGAVAARGVAYDNTSSGLLADTVQNAINEVNDKVEAIDVPDVSGFVDSSDLATVATTGSYNDLTNKPAIPTVPANVSAFTNDAGYLTAHQDISGKANTADLATVAFSGDYDDLANKPSIPSTTGLASESYVNNAIEAATGDLATLEDIEGFAVAADLSTVATSGSYNDLTDKPTIPAAPDLTPYATKQELTAKADAASLATVATTGDYDDLTNKPTIPVLPTLATVATSGSYNDLSDKPTIPETYIGNDGITIPPMLFGINPFSAATYQIVSSTDDFQEKFLAGYICRGNSTSTYRITMDGNWHNLRIEKNGDNYTVNLTTSGTIDVTSGRLVWRTGKNNYTTIVVRGSNITDEQFKDVFVKLLKDNFLTYSNTNSGLTATTVQGAIDELAANSGGASTAAQLSYDNTNTWNDGTDTDTVQEAIDSLYADVNGLPVYVISETFDANTKSLTLSVVEDSGM